MDLAIDLGRGFITQGNQWLAVVTNGESHEQRRTTTKRGLVKWYGTLVIREGNDPR